MKPTLTTLAGLGSTSALLIISMLGLAGIVVPFGGWVAPSLILLAVLALEARAMWKPGAGK